MYVTQGWHFWSLCLCALGLSLYRAGRGEHVYRRKHITEFPETRLRRVKYASCATTQFLQYLWLKWEFEVCQSDRIQRVGTPNRRYHECLRITIDLEKRIKSLMMSSRPMLFGSSQKTGMTTQGAIILAITIFLKSPIESISSSEPRWYSRITLFEEWGRKWMPLPIGPATSAGRRPDSAKEGQ